MTATLDQRRAAHAWKGIEDAQRDQKGFDDFVTHAKKLPTRIMTAGLGPALAFLRAKAGNPRSKDYKKTLDDLHKGLSDWVIAGRGLKATSPSSLLESVVNGDSQFLRVATDESLAYLQWLNRFAEANEVKAEKAQEE